MPKTVDVCFAAFVSTRDEHWKDSENQPMAEGIEVILAPAIRISHFTKEVRDRLSEACQMRHYAIPAGAGLNPTYGIVREDAPGDTWDSDEVISLILGLSRIVHQSTLGTDLSGSLHYGPAGQLEAIFAVYGAKAWNSPSQRPWLTERDWTEVGSLYRAYQALPIIPLPETSQRPTSMYGSLFEEPKSKLRLPVRLHRALWNLAYAAFVRPAHIRWLIVATALEGIIETGGRARQEFIQRIPAIGQEIGVPITRDEADQIYSIRSTAAHRGWISGKTDDELDASYTPMDRIVSGILRHAIYDHGFRSSFESRETISARWPLTVSAEVM
jgi:hypothetical protein